MSILRRPGARIAALLAAGGLIAYSSALAGGFIWDDDYYVTRNPLLWSFGGLWKIWFSAQTVQYYPLVFTSFWIEQRLWGLNPLGYHFVNVALHLANAVLLGAILKKLEVRGAWLAAAAFALHPVHVESVAWITERKNVLSGLFFFLSLWSYLRHEETGRRTWYFGALAFFIAGLFSKTVVCVLPAVIIVLRWMRRDSWSRGVAVRLAPFFAAGLAMGLVTVAYEKFRVGAQGAEWSLMPAQHAALAGKIAVFYVQKLLWPARLSFIYPRWNLERLSAADWIPTVLIVTLLGGALLLQRRIGRRPAAALLIYLALLFPALGFFSVYPMRYSYVADHFQYLASAATLALLIELVARWMLARNAVRAGLALSAAVLCALGFLTWKQGFAYQSEAAIWEDTIAKNPEAIIAHNNLGVIYRRQKRYAEAIARFEDILARAPGNAEAHHNLGNVYVEMNDAARAEAYFRKAMALEPALAEPYAALGRLQALQKKYAEAEANFHAAIRLDPRASEPHSNLALMRFEQKRWDESEASFRKALEMNPGSLEARFNLGVLQFERGNYREAVLEFEEAMKLSPQDPRIHQVIARAAGLSTTAQK